MKKLNLYLLAGLCAIGSVTYGQDKRFPIGNSSNVLNDYRNQLLKTKQPNGKSLLQLRISSSLTLPAAINFRRSTGTQSEQLSGSIENVPNSSFYLMIDGKSVIGHILLRNTKKAYTYFSDEKGAVFVEETDIDKVVCIDYNKAATTAGDEAGINEPAANAVAAVTDLQSYPGGNGCVLLDFDGQYVSGTGWNNGNPINAAPANLSDADKENVWRLISEDFRPFHLNVTTSEAVFNTYPKTKRMRCIFTPTNTAAPGAGGVAYLGSFRWNDETPCWVFNSGARAAGEAGSHEVGHTFGLAHDGRTSPDEDYYQGQGNWAPIMGVGYYKSLVQWSKGEYANPSTTQDDLAMIAGATYGVGYRADDYGNSVSAATALTINASGTVNNSGVIERTGDVDMFSFNTAGGNVNLSFNANTWYPGLDILATLYDMNGTAITSSNPTTLNASISTTLAAGTYYVSVTGTGSGNPATTGYSNYGSLGAYTITGTVAGGSTPSGIAIFYKDCNYTGTFAIGLNEGGYTTAQLTARGITNKDISSIKISPGFEVVLYKNDNFTGAFAGYTGDVSCLVSSGWNDSAASLRIRSVTNTLPTVNITSPASGNTYTAPATITINASASDGDGAISKVEFFNGNTKLGEDATSPYSFTWSNASGGTYTIRAVATDDRGGQATAQVNFIINNPPGAIVYKHCNYGGYAINLPVGTYTVNQLMALGAINDDVSSLKVNSGYEVILYRDNNFAGPAYLFRSNTTCLVNVGLSGGTAVNLNDWTSSVVVRQAAAARTMAPGVEEGAIPFTEFTASLQILPNPVHDEMVIRYGNMGESFDLKILDVNGAIVYSAPRIMSGQHINITSLRTGVYFIKINTGKETITKKLIKR
ncbi:Ig-like domain-containing protein [Longitalea arenae]|uniref:Ig-like domain-containing protein n=1 Tax=Longitalea arenae TaxID=2812558 RepID=UPI0019683C89|nr:Ig-like domain-containing protein [Longitalea arenae]